MGFIMKLKESYKNKQQRKQMKKLTRNNTKWVKKPKNEKREKNTHLLRSGRV
jgi:hypothetical protein